MFSEDEFVERLIFIEKVKTGIKQSEEGDIISEAELESEVKKWFE